MRCICRNTLQVHKRIFENKRQRKMLHIPSILYFSKAIHHFDRRGSASHYGTMVINCKKAFQNKKAVFCCTWFLWQWIDKFNSINTWDTINIRNKNENENLRNGLHSSRFQMDVKAFFKVIFIQIPCRRCQKAPQSISAQSDVTFQVKSRLKFHQLTLCWQISDSHEKKNLLLPSHFILMVDNLRRHSSQFQGNQMWIFKIKALLFCCYTFLHLL